jgi:lipopolysaccharide transport system ATP-binding protein
MSSDRPAVRVTGLGKRYRLGPLEAWPTLRDSLAGTFRRTRADAEAESRMIWALRDVSFDIPRGEAVGVIGSNGSGKTTLLKILSRVTPPTTGEARVRGRVGSLLEVGTGFHPELTGRENVYLSGAILGMRRAEIARKFDTIVAFAEMERFIDTPVKRYSSGMYIRLAFAVAAHLDVDILLVDEVLAVGDYGFQRRSVGKMRDETESEGRTVLFVSHSLAAVKALTDRCIWLDRGRVVEFGPTEEVFRNYVASFRQRSGSGYIDLSDIDTHRPSGVAQDITFHSLELRSLDGTVTDTHFEGDPVELRVRMQVRKPLEDVRLEITCTIATLEDVDVFSAVSTPDVQSLETGLYETSFALAPNPLRSGDYTVSLDAMTMSDRVRDRREDAVESAATLHVEANPTSERELRHLRADRGGLIHVEFEWEPLTPIGVDLGDALRPRPS